MDILKRLGALFKQFPSGSRYDLSWLGSEPVSINISYCSTEEELFKLQKFIFDWMGIRPYLYKPDSEAPFNELRFSIYDNQKAVKRLTNCLEEYYLAYKQTCASNPIATDVVVEGTACVKYDFSGYPLERFTEIRRRLASLMNLPFGHPFFEQKTVKKGIPSFIVQLIKNWAVNEEQLKDICAILEKDPKFLVDETVEQQICLPKVLCVCFGEEIVKIIADK